jgi:membrane-associated protein
VTTLLNSLADLVAAATAAPHAVLAIGPDWLSAQGLLERFGTAAFLVSVFIIFAECGLLVGFFLPGDSLLFLLGVFIGAGKIDVNIFVAAIVLTIAAALGNITGYWIGAKAGPPLFNRPNSRLFKQEYVDATAKFFDKHGPRAIFLARFVPIVRTFITATAGVARMDFRVFLIWSVLGAIAWAAGLTIAGYYLGGIDIVANNIETVLIVVVLISVLPIVFEYVSHRRKRGSESA